jgi:hypothetical protein
MRLTSICCAILAAAATISACGQFGAAPDPVAVEPEGGVDGGLLGDAGGEGDLDASVPDDCTEQLFDDLFAGPALDPAWSMAGTASWLQLDAAGFFRATLPADAHVAAFLARNLTPSKAKAICIDMDVTVESKPGGFDPGAFVTFLQMDLRETNGDTEKQYFGLGVNSNGMFVNAIATDGTQNVGSPVVLLGAASKHWSIRIEVGGGRRRVSISVENQSVSETAVLATLPAIGYVHLGIGVGPSEDTTKTTALTTVSFDRLTVRQKK